VCLIRALESEEFLITALAKFIIFGAPEGELYSLVLESDKTKSFLNFENNHGLTLRHVLNQDDQKFTKLVEKIVNINEENKRDEYMNVLLLDKINRREDVLKQLIKF